MKTVTKRHGKEDTLRDVAILQRTFNRLRKNKLIPKGVYHFDSMKEADQWLIQKIISTHEHQNSKT